MHSKLKMFKKIKTSLFSFNSEVYFFSPKEYEFLGVEKK